MTTILLCILTGILPEQWKVGEPAALWIDMGTSTYYVDSATPDFQVSIYSIDGATLDSWDQDTLTYNDNTGQLFGVASYTPQAPGQHTLLIKQPIGNIGYNATRLESIIVDEDIREIRKTVEASGNVLRATGFVPGSLSWSLVGVDTDRDIALMGDSLSSDRPTVMIRVLEEGVTLHDQYPGGNITYASYELPNDTTYLGTNVYRHRFLMDVPAADGTFVAHTYIHDGSKISHIPASFAVSSSQGILISALSEDRFTELFLDDFHAWAARVASGAYPSKWKVWFWNGNQLRADDNVSSSTSFYGIGGTVGAASYSADLPWGSYDYQELFDYDEGYQLRATGIPLATDYQAPIYHGGLESVPN